MQTSPAIGNLVAALALARAKFRAITKDRNASIQSAKGSFRYSYADLATVTEATVAALSDNGLAVLQPVRSEDGSVIVTTVLAHSSGEWISEEMRWPVASTDNRSIGSGITYARRHSMLAMVGAAATDEDDDAETARGGDHDTARPSAKPASKPVIVKEMGPAKRTAEERKRDIVAELKAFGYEPAGITHFVKETLGHDKAQDDADLDRLESALVIIRASKNADKAADLNY